MALRMDLVSSYPCSYLFSINYVHTGSRCGMRKGCRPTPFSPSALSLSSCIRQLEPVRSATWLLRPTSLACTAEIVKRQCQRSSRSAPPAQPARPSSLARPTLSFRGLAACREGPFPPPVPPVARDRRLGWETATASPPSGSHPRRIPTVFRSRSSQLRRAVETSLRGLYRQLSLSDTAGLARFVPSSRCLHVG